MLTTIAALKLRLGIQDSDVKDDDLMNAAIAALSSRIEDRCNRKFGYAVNVQQEFEADSMQIVVANYPINEAQPITFQYRRTAAEGWLNAQNVDYLVNGGCIISLHSLIGSRSMQARVIYSGGYVLPDMDPVAGVDALPADIENAVIEQLAFWFQNKSHLGASAVAGQGGSVSFRGLAGFAKEASFLPGVQDVVDQHERWNM